VQCFNGRKTRVRKEVGEVETYNEMREEILGMKIGMEFSFEMFFECFILVVDVCRFKNI
jgi:amino acid permease